MKRLTLIGLFLMGSHLSAAGANGPALDGKLLYMQKNCNTCHGLTGNETIQKTYPKLAGQNADYLFNQLKSFKSKTRTNDFAMQMQAILIAVNEEEMKAISTYLSTL